MSYVTGNPRSQLGVQSVKVKATLLPKYIASRCSITVLLICDDINTYFVNLSIYRY